jgi:rRNA-processing protein FCF1
MRRARRELKVLDTSAVIDGRFVELRELGLLEGEMRVPRFVLGELHTLADSADDMRRARGRRGLDLLARLKDVESQRVEVFEADFPDIPDVDNKLLRLAAETGAVVLTVDHNLTSVARVRGVGVLNLNEVASAMRPNHLPGERIRLRVAKEGKEPGQGVGYLEDGTMVVVAEGRDRIGRDADVEVTSVLQTSAGRMIFSRFSRAATMAAAMRSPDTAVVIVAGGTGTRFGRAGGKQLAALAGRPVFAHSFAAAAAVDRVGLVVVACPPERIEEYATALAADAPGIEAALSPRGATPGLCRLRARARFPTSTPTWRSRRRASFRRPRPVRPHGSGPPGCRARTRGRVVGHPSVDTLKTVENGPCGGDPGPLALLDGPDPAGLSKPARCAPRTTRPPNKRSRGHRRRLPRRGRGRIGRVLEGPRDNIKVTLAEDLAVAEALLSARAEGGC